MFMFWSSCSLFWSSCSLFWSRSCYRVGLSKTRCEYVRVRSAPPSMAPQGFGKAYPASAPNLISKLFQFFSRNPSPMLERGRWGGASENVRSHGWRSPSVTWTCRRSVFQKPHPTGHPTPNQEARRTKAPNPKFRTYTSEAPGEPPWPDALRRDRRPTAEPERNRTKPSAGNHHR